ncbi:MAG: hypothetical protein RJA16_1138 [Planctomycetota bacterium]
MSDGSGEDRIGEVHPSRRARPRTSPGNQRSTSSDRNHLCTLSTAWARPRVLGGIDGSRIFAGRGDDLLHVASTNFSNVTVHLQFTADTTNISGNGYATTGDQIGFTLTGGSLGSDLSGTFASSQNWRFEAFDATRVWTFAATIGSNTVNVFGFKAPSADGPFTTNGMLTSSYSKTVTTLPSSGTGDYSTYDAAGGATPWANWAGAASGGVGSTLGTFILTPPGSTTYYNGSFGIPYSPSAVPGAGMAGLAAIGLAGLGRRRRR